MRDQRLGFHPDVFWLELGGGLGNVAYVPELGCAAQCFCGRLPEELRAEIGKWQERHGRQDAGMPEMWSVHSLTVLPTWNCNFHCAYCYAAGGRRQGGGKLTVVQILSAVERMIKEFVGPWELNFAGGGEPLLAWEIVQKSIEKVRQKAPKSDSRLRLGLVTNASLVTSAVAEFLARQEVQVTVSWDILPDVQERQRGMPVRVVDGIQKLVDAGVDVTVRATVMPGNETRQTEMVREWAKVFPRVRTAVFEPALPDGGTDESFRCFIEGFLSGFKDARREGFMAKLKLETGLLGRLQCTGVRFCGSGWVLTPDGGLTLCHRIAHMTDTKYGKFAFGRVSEDGVVEIDNKLRCRWMAEDSVFATRCRNCFARWNCGGGCRVRNMILPESRRRFLCHVMRRELRAMLAERMSGIKTAE